MRSLWTLGAVGIVVLVGSVTLGATLTVDLDGGADSTDIQSAIDAVADGDTVLVKPGEYVITEPINFNRLHDPENPASPPMKDIVVRSEGGAEVTTIRMSETPADPDRAIVVIFEKGEAPDSILDGFRVAGGTGPRGGGIRCDHSSPTLTNCTISRNSAEYGAGVYCSSSSPTLMKCTIVENSARNHGDCCPAAGGGIYATDSSPRLSNCTVSGNSAFGGGDPLWSAGGGIHLTRGSATLTDCTISGNSAEYSGGGVWCGESSPTLTNCTISANSSPHGGSVFCRNSAPTFTDCVISGSSARLGGGMYCRDGSSPTLTNSTISGNSALCGGSMYGRDGASPTLTNCTICCNSAWAEGDGIHCSSDFAPRLTNCIFWGNDNESPYGVLSFCLADRNPLFVRSGNWVDCDSPAEPLCIPYEWDSDSGEPMAWHRYVPGDYRLQPGSPAIDAGTSEGAPTTDFEGRGRPCGAGVDIGAFEFGDCPASAAHFQRGDANADGGVNITDGILTLNYLFLGGTASSCADAADLDDGGGINITDAIYLLNFLFLGGPAPAAPFDACGIDETIDDLDCAAFAPCGMAG